jgi:CRISPR/Cas system-associated exonuclease Cas4 (RecB family)
MWRRCSYVLVGLSLTACAAAASYREAPVASARRDVITAAEIVAARVTDVYQAVNQLRPEFLRRRGDLAFNYAPSAVQVYVDDLPFGTSEALRLIPLDQVRLIRYISPVEADLRFGGRHVSGAILVTTLK